MTKKQKAQSKSVISEIHQTFDVYIVPYQMAKDIWLDEITEVHENIPVNQQLSKNIAKRLALSVEDVTVESFDDNDGCVVIRLKIRGSKQDIDKVNKVLKAREDSVEQE